MHTRSEIQQSVISYVEKSGEEQFGLLEQLVLQQSYSRFKPGVDAVGRRIAVALQEIGMTCEVIRESELGDLLLFRSPAYRFGQPSLLLFGHMDTVYPVESPFNWYKEDGGKSFGPGVIDMKGGLVAAVFTLKALAACGALDSVPITFICNSDEEIGSPASGPLIKREAERGLFSLGFECGGLHGEIVTGRRGKAGYLLVVKGKAGHAAFAGEDKTSAILELAHKIIALERLNDYQRKIVVNVGLIKGGIGPNTVADSASAEIDVRYLEPADAEELAMKIERLATACTVSGTRCDLYKTSSRSPMVQSSINKELFRLICREAVSLGMACREELRSGVSDANIIAAAGIPVVDGMGPIGGCDHSDEEYMIKGSLSARTKLAALSILSCWEHFSG